MHSSPDRDNFVTINYGNIQRGTESNFGISYGSSNYGTPYDYESIMHYPKYGEFHYDLSITRLLLIV